MNRILICTAHLILLVLMLAAPASPAHAQGSTFGESVFNLRNETPQRVEIVLGLIEQDWIERDDVIGALTLMLDDQRKAWSKSGPSNISGRIAEKLKEQPAAAALSIVRRLPEISTDAARILALQIITEIGKPNNDTYDLVLPYCRSGDSSLRIQAIYALDSVAEDNEKATNQFGEFLRERDPLIRRAAFSAVSNRPAMLKPLMPSIIALLDDEAVLGCPSGYDASLRTEAIRLLIKHAPLASDALPKLQKLIAPDNNESIRIWSAAGICVISPTESSQSLDVLREYLFSDSGDDSTNFDAEKALIAIIAIGKPAAPLLDDLELLKKHPLSSVRWHLPAAFFAIDSTTAMHRVMPMIESDKEVMAAAIRALGNHKVLHAEVFDAYIRALTLDGTREDDIANAQDAAIDAFTKLGPMAIPALPALVSLANNPDISDSLRENIQALLDTIPMLR